MDIIFCIDDEYGLSCLQQSINHNGKTIDKLTFTVPRGYFIKNIFQFDYLISNEMFYIENCHNKFFKLHLYGEHVNPQIPMIDSVMRIFNVISQKQIFYEEVNQKIRTTLEKCANDNTSVEFISFLNTANFRLSELELAFDFFGCMPFTESALEFKEYINSLFDNGYKTSLEDDSHGHKTDGIRDSMVAIYDRAEELNVYESVWRVEWRLRDDGSLGLLENNDLRFKMDSYIIYKGHRLKRIFYKWVQPNSIYFKWNYINNHFPIFSALVSG